MGDVEQIRDLGMGGHDERVARVAAHRAEVREHIALLQATDRFLDHLAACRHPVIADCAPCSEFAGAQQRANRLRDRP